MKFEYLNCDKSEGTIEVALSKREISVENAKLAIDYKVCKDGYEFSTYYGFNDTDIMIELEKFVISVAYGSIKDKAKSYVENILADDNKKKNLREALRGLKGKMPIKSELD